MTHYARKSDAILLTSGSGALVIAENQVHAISTIEAPQLSTLCQRMTTPLAEAGALELADRETLDLLCEVGLIAVGAEETLKRNQPAPSHPNHHLVICVSGAIGAAEMIATARQLRQGHFGRVDVVLTDAARRFVEPNALEHYGLPVWTDPFERRGDVRVPHIHLAEVADIVLVMPASAHTIYKLAHGVCSDVLSLVVASTRAPVVIVPAMNEQMWRYGAVSRNVQTLRELGHYIVEPAVGVEISSGLDAVPTFGGPGVAAGRVGLMLTAVLDLRRASA